MLLQELFTLINNKNKEAVVAYASKEFEKDNPDTYQVEEFKNEHSKNKIILITELGSFGSKLAEYILKKIPVKKIIIFSRDEDKQYRMKSFFKSNLLEYRLEM